MASLTLTTEPVIIAPANPNRTMLLITNLSDTMVYVDPKGEITEFVNRAWPLKLNGVFDVHGPGCYKGPIFAMTSAASDIRVFDP